MRFVTFEQDNQSYAGILLSDQQFILPLQQAESQLLGESTLPDSVQGIIEAGESAIIKIKQVLNAAETSKTVCLLPVETVQLLAPIPRPKKNIFCIGKNYVEHALEFEKTRDTSAVPKYPIIFSKPPTCVVGPNAVVKGHSDITTKVDYEVELAVVIGKTASKVTKETAFDYVFGYTIINDVTARDLQGKHGQWLMGKGPDTFAPMGPSLVHKSEIPNPHSLSITCTINGELRQNGHTGDMIFDIPTLIAAISSVITLEPGDIIATGTPSGVGVAMVPPRFLKSGDIMELKVEKIGVLKNTFE